MRKDKLILTVLVNPLATEVWTEYEKMLARLGYP